MKITKDYIKKLILEELKEQAQEKVTSGDYKRQQMKAAAATTTGIDDKERAVLARIEAKLKQIATKGNLLASGRVTQILGMLEKEIDKALKK